VFYGTTGAIYIKGHYGTGQLYLYDNNREWEDQPMPEEITANIPDVDGDTEKCWHYLAREFVNDIGGESVEPYPTFREGSHYQ